MCGTRESKVAAYQSDDKTQLRRSGRACTWKSANSNAIFVLTCAVIREPVCHDMCR
jgi:hypothetical protein